jgi:hypothetical protein
MSYQDAQQDVLPTIIKKALFREFIPYSPLTDNRMPTKRTPNKSNIVTKSQNTVTS